MQIIAKRTLQKFWQIHPHAENPLRAWFSIADKAKWKSPQDVKNDFGSSVDFVDDNRVIFDIGGNKYRLIIHVAYKYKRVLIKFIGTHKEYDHIDPEKIK